MRKRNYNKLTIKRFMKLKWKDMDVPFKIGGTTGLLCGGLVGLASIIAIFSLVALTPYWGQYNLLDFSTQYVYEDVSKIWSEKNITKTIAHLCEFEDTDLDKVDCVKTFVCRHYDYKLRYQLNIITPSPEDLIENGGVCRDYAIFYKSIFDNLGLDNTLKLVPHHVYNIVYIDGIAYGVDQCSEIMEEVSEIGDDKVYNL